MGIGAHSNRQAALSAGVLFITATVANVIGTGLSRSLLDDPDYLTAVSSNANRVAAGALLELVAAGASVGIAISLYPVLKKWGASLALGSVVFRTAEAVMYMIAWRACCRCWHSASGSPQRWLSIRRRSEPSAMHCSMCASRSRSSGCSPSAWVSLLYYYLFYRSRLVPRWLSGWGIGAIILMFLACLLALFRQNELTTYTILALPLGVQEMVLAVWLIAKGFSTPAPPSIRAAEREPVSVGR